MRFPHRSPPRAASLLVALLYVGRNLGFSDIEVYLPPNLPLIIVNTGENMDPDPAGPRR